MTFGNIAVDTRIGFYISIPPTKIHQPGDQSLPAYEQSGLDARLPTHYPIPILTLNKVKQCLPPRSRD